MIAHLCLGVWYSWLTPIWEGYDEPSHAAYVQYIRENRSLPSPDSDAYFTDDTWQFTQPPLYYILGAIWLAPWRVPLDTIRLSNPFGPTDEGGRMFIPNSREDFPWQGTALGVHLLRLLSVAISAFLVLLTHRIAQLVFPGSPGSALAGTAVVAFCPQVLFLGAIVNNDILAATLGSAVIYISLRGSQRGFRRSDWVALPAAVLLTAATKNTVVLLLPAVAVAVAIGFTRLLLVYWPWPRARMLAPLLVILTVVGALYGLFAYSPIGFWFARRFGGALVGIPDALLDMASLGLPAEAAAPMSEPTLMAIWAAFGWGNIIGPAWLYWMLGGLTVAALFGVLWMLRGRSRLLVLMLMLTILGAASSRLFSTNYPLWGRYLMIAFPAYAILLVAGLTTLLRREWISAPLITIAMLAFALLAGWSILQPAYAPPPTYANQGHLPSEATPLEVSFGEDIEILGYRLGRSQAMPGESVPITLYVRALKPIQGSYALSVQLIDRQHNVIAAVNSYPGHGNLPTPLWKPTETIADTYTLMVPADVSAPVAARILLTFFEVQGPDLRYLVASEPGVSFGQLKITSDISAAVAAISGVEASYGSVADLLSHSTAISEDGKRIEVTAVWRAREQTFHDYVAFIHAVDGNGRLVAQSDSEPRGGKYPTSVWEPGELIIDRHSIELPSGIAPSDVRIHVGMYEQGSPLRVSAADRNGHPLEGDVFTFSP